MAQCHVGVAHESLCLDLTDNSNTLTSQRSGYRHLVQQRAIASIMQFWAFLIPLALSALLLVVNQLALPPTYLRPKIFVLGLSKTGTTSVGNALALLGYKRIGWKDIRSRHLVHTFINGDLDPLIEQTRHFDAFEDLPWPYIYREMAEMYPDAKFVLTLRKDEGTWLKSLRRHMGRGTWEPATYFYGAPSVEGNEETVLDRYRNHTASVREYFQDKPDRYIELVIDDGDANWKDICRVAHCPQGGVPTIGFPKSNTAAHWHDGSFRSWPRSLWISAVSRTEEVTSSLYYGRRWPIVNRILELVWSLVTVTELAICDLYFRFFVQNQKPLPVA